MIVAVHQPNYLPSLSFFDKMQKCETFVFLDDAQYTTNSFINRNRINTPNGKLWITVPVKRKYRQLIRDVEIDNSQKWAKTHLNTFKAYYGYSNHFLFLEPTYSMKWNKLIDLNITLITYIISCLGKVPRMILSSTLGITTTGTQRLIDICKKLGADSYLSGKGGKNYQDTAAFADAGISLVYQNYEGTNLPAINFLLRGPP